MTFNRQRFLVLIGLWTLFGMVYPVCNYITSLRAGVYCCCFAWERGLPFVPALFIPYMSIDLFFVLAPFVALTAAELRTYTLRVAVAILLAGTCWLIFPMKYGFDRPPVTGWLGVGFEWFRAMDLPFNQCPSLHIGFLVIMRDLYSRRTRGRVRLGIDIWFCLIVLSTVLTYQHHVVDLTGGFFLGVLCLYLFPGPPLVQPTILNLRVAGYYALGTLAMVGLSFVFLPWSLFLLWPAFSLVSCAAGYMVFGATIFRKQDGRLPLPTWLFMWPVLLGQRLSLAYYARQCRAYDVLTDNLWIGRRLSPAQARQAIASGVRAVVDLTGEFSEPAVFRGLNYLQLSVLDLTAPHRSQIDQAVEFIQQNRRNGIVYVHCKAGYSRTAVIAGAYLLASGEAATPRAAIEMLRRARPTIVIRPEALRAIHGYHKVCDAAESTDAGYALMANG